MSKWPNGTQSRDEMDLHQRNLTEVTMTLPTLSVDRPHSRTSRCRLRSYGLRLHEGGKVTTLRVGMVKEFRFFVPDKRFFQYFKDLLVENRCCNMLAVTRLENDGYWNPVIR